MKRKYTYETKLFKGIEYRYKCWNEYFLDEDTGNKVMIKRRALIKIDGIKVYWNPMIRKVKNTL